MIKLRRERIAALGVVIFIVTILTWKAEIFGSEVSVPYEPPLADGDAARPPVAHENIDIEPPSPKVTTPLDSPKDSHKNDEDEHRNQVSRPAIGPLTTIPDGSHSHGFTLLDNLYLRNGTLYIVTQDQSKFPAMRNMISRPVKMEEPDLDPTDNEMRFLKTEDVEDVLGKHAIRVEGLSVMIYDPPQFMSHLYHWWGEIILGAQRILSHEGSKTKTTLTPERFLLPFCKDGEFRDHAGLDMPLMRAAFPRASLEESDYWEDLKALDATVMFERVMLVNRPAAHQAPLYANWFKMISGTMDVTVPDDFWAPIRQAIVRNILGYVPEPEKNQATTAEASVPKPVVTYISRQGTRRILRAADHKALVQALKGLEAEGICEFREAQMERLSFREQIELVARSTIIIGVHGNGLTHQLWMPPSRRSAVFEIFYPKGFLFDYEMLARNMGHKHYAVWDDQLLTYPKGKYHSEIKIDSEEFHGNEIPVHAETVVNAIKKRLSEEL